jgi:hypothetical protein
MLFLRTKPDENAGEQALPAEAAPAKRSFWSRIRRAKAEAVDAEVKTDAGADESDQGEWPPAAYADAPSPDAGADESDQGEWSPAAYAGAPSEDADTAPQDDEVPDTASAKPASKWRRLFGRKTHDSGEHQLPIRLLAGFLSEVSERDAREFARGLAQKYCENLSIAYIDVFRFGSGWVYEVQEGGAGRAYLPAVIEHFLAQGEYEQGKSVAVVLRTASRLVKVERTRDGLTATQLPEQAQETPAEWVRPTLKMAPAISTMLPLLVIGGAFAATGALAFGAANLARVQPYMPPPAPKTERVDLSRLPHAQTRLLSNLRGEEDYVTALIYQNGTWTVRTHLQDTAAQPPAMPSQATTAQTGPGAAPAQQATKGTP